MWARLESAFTAAWRLLCRSPANTVAVVLVLSAAVVANAMVAAVWERTVARPLPYESPASLVNLEVGGSPAPPGRFMAPFGHEIVRLRDESAAFARIDRWAPTRAVLGVGQRARTVRLARLGPDLLGLLDAPLYLGRGFLPAEHETGAATTGSVTPERVSSAILLSHELWRTVFGMDPRVVGTNAVLDGAPVRVVGVMGPDFRFPDGSWDGWLPMPGPEPKPATGSFTMTASPTVARLNPGWSPAAAQQEAAALLRNAGERPDAEVRLESLADAAGAWIRPTLDILRLGSFLLLLAASASVVGLHAAGSLNDRKSVAIRRSLGSRGFDQGGVALFRIVLLAVSVAALATLIVQWLLPLARYFTGAAAADFEASLPWRTAVRAALVGTAAVIAAELPSFLTGLGSDRSTALSRSARSTRLFARVFLVFGTATATTMLIAATVLSGSTIRILGGAHGYADAGLAQITLDFAGPGGNSLSFPGQVDALDQLARRLRASTGVAAVGFADTLPDEMSGDGWAPSGSQPSGPGGAVHAGRRRAVSPGLFAALGLPVLRGRGFLGTDGPGAEAIGVMDTRAAALSDRPDPLGLPERSGSESVRIVGIVPEVRLFGRQDSLATLHVPFAQRSTHSPLRKVEVVARFRAPPSGEQLLALSRVPAEVHPAFRVLRTESVRDRRIRALGSPVFGAFALAVFSAAGLLLAVIGAAGQVLETVARSERQVAIRRAFGAPDRRVVREVAQETAVFAGIGVALGALLGLVVVRFAGNRVMWVETDHLLSYAAPVALILLCVSVACYQAARRVTRRSPSAALRSL